jgi:glycerate kinase
MRALAAPSSLKGVLTAVAAAAALARGLRSGGADAVEQPVADGGEGTVDALYRTLGGEWHTVEVADAFDRPRMARWLALPDQTVAIEAAEAIPLDPSRLDAWSASSKGLGQLIAAVGRPRALLVGLGGVATTDGGVGLRQVIDELPAPTRLCCDVDVPLLDAARLFAAQKGATADQIPLLEARLSGIPELQPYADVPGAGAAGGLGAALASLGGVLVAGAPYVLELMHFSPASFDLVVTGEGTVDRTTALGKAPGAVLRASRAVGTRCVVFGGRVVDPLPGVETIALSGQPERAEEDLVELGIRLAVG